MQSTPAQPPPWSGAATVYALCRPALDCHHLSARGHAQRWRRVCREATVASYHCSVKTGGRGRGAKHADYIAGRDDYQRGDIEAKGHGNMPAWAARRPGIFWAAADEFEREKGLAYLELEVALPRELSPEERLDLVRDIIREQVGADHAYEWAIHCPQAAIGGGEQPHLHLMWSPRICDGIDRDPDQYFRRYNAKAPERGGCKKSTGGKSRGERDAEIRATRERVARITNRHLERAGMDGRVDHRSLWERGINREPERRIGPGRDRLTPEVVAALLGQRAAVREAEAAAAAVSALDLSGGIRAALAARDAGQVRDRTQRAAPVQVQGKPGGAGLLVAGGFAAARAALRAADPYDRPAPPEPEPEAQADPLEPWRAALREAERAGDADEAELARADLAAAERVVARGAPPEAWIVRAEYRAMVDEERQAAQDDDHDDRLR